MHFEAALELPSVSVQQLWDFHDRADALSSLIEPGAGVSVVRHQWPLEIGSESLLMVPFLPGSRMAWLARISEYEPPHRFVDEQVEGPFAAWRHEHLMVETPEGCRLEDRITYRLRWWQWPGAWYVRSQLRRTFAYRHRVTEAWCRESS